MLWMVDPHTFDLPLQRCVYTKQAAEHFIHKLWKESELVNSPVARFKLENGELRESERTHEKWVGSYSFSLCPPLLLFQTKGRLFLVTFIFNHLRVWSLMSLFMLGWGVSGLWAHRLPGATRSDHNRRPPSRHILCRGTQYATGRYMTCQ